jgi:hypothetical protein
VGISRVSVLLCAVLCSAWHVPALAADTVAALSVSPDQPALEFLKSLPREWSGTSDRDCKTYEDKNIDALVRPFAVSAARFLKAFVEVHGAVTITSAYRSAEEQTCVCIGEKGPCAGKPRVVRVKKGKRFITQVVSGGMSRHQHGIALDVRPGAGTEDEFICMQEFARLNPQFGVHFPLGRADYPHMEPLGSRAPNIKLAAKAVTIGAARTPAVTPCSKMKIMLTHQHVD